MTRQGDLSSKSMWAGRRGLEVNLIIYKDLGHSNGLSTKSEMAIYVNLMQLIIPRIALFFPGVA